MDKVKLTNSNPLVDDREFDLAHANRILKRGNTGGWSLPENSEFIYDQTNGIIKRPSSGTTKKSKEQADN